MKYIRDEETLISLARDYREVIIFGAGILAERCFNSIKDNTIVKSFFVSAKYKNPSSLFGVPVITLSEDICNNIDVDQTTPIFVCVAKKNYGEVIDFLNNYGFYNLIVVSSDTIFHMNKSQLQYISNIDSCLVSDTVQFECDETSSIRFGDHVVIDDNVHITARNHAKIYISDNSNICSDVRITADNNSNIDIGKNTIIKEKNRITAIKNSSIIFGDNGYIGDESFLYIGDSGNMSVGNKFGFNEYSFVAVTEGGY